jgi:hypothetical protein
MSEVLRKKRGRKPKVIVDNEPVQPTINVQENPDTPKKGKRGRKPKQVYISVDAGPSDNTKDDDVNASSLSDDENVIVRLSVPDITNLSDDNEHPCAYNEQVYDNQYMFNVDENEDLHERKNAIISSDLEHKVINVLQDFEERNKNNEWPLHTSIACYWCCHRFNNAPIGIPINYDNGVFEVYGCFCSTNCAAAYNFNENTNQDEMWERYQLLNLLSRRMNGVAVVKAAPPRLSLKIFGGHLDIDDFRAHSHGNKFVNINFPPMTSVTQQLEEISDYEIFTDCKYIPVDNERINKYKEKISFKRSKPLVDSKKSIESSMNLRFST